MVFLYFGDPMRSIRWREPGRRRFGIVLRKDEAALEHRFQEDEDAEEMPVGAGEHDGRHSANDGEMNDDDSAEGYLAEFFKFEGRVFCLTKTEKKIGPWEKDNPKITKQANRGWGA